MVKHIEKSEPSPETSFKPSEHAQPEAHTKSVGPCLKATCSTSTLGGRGGQIEGEKREYRDVLYAVHKNGYAF